MNIIKDLMNQFPQDSVVRIKKTDQIAQVFSYNENGTMSVVIDQEDNPGIINAMFLKKYKVFGLKPSDLELIKDIKCNT